MTEAYHDWVYLDLVRDVLWNGVKKENRTGIDTYAVFSRNMRFNISDGTIPMLTTKKMHVRSIIHELLWYLQGSTNIKYLQDNGVRIWNEWADENGDLGPVYGYQWRKWPKAVGAKINWETDPPSAEVEYEHIDQIANVIHTLRTNPNDRRMIVNAWNVSMLPDMALPPCHYTFQFFVAEGKLSCKLTQRSCDVGLGVPFNIVQYSILTHMIAQVTGLKPGEFVWEGGDVHIYHNQLKPLMEQISRDPFPSPKLKLNADVKEIDDFKYEDFEIVNYKSHPTIKMEVAV